MGDRRAGKMPRLIPKIALAEGLPAPFGCGMLATSKVVMASAPGVLAIRTPP